MSASRPCQPNHQAWPKRTPCAVWFPRDLGSVRLVFRSSIPLMFAHTGEWRQLIRSGLSVRRLLRRIAFRCLASVGAA